MAVYTVSNTGGNYNATSSWVGGVVPLTTDTVATTATSGPLTINVSSTCAGTDFTNYVSTLTINAGFEFTINGPIVLVAAMSISGTGYFVAGGTSTIRTNGLTIPWFRVSGQNNTRTLLDNLSCTNFLQTAGNQNPALAGSFTMSVANFRTSGSGGGSYGWLVGTVPIVFNAANCYYESVLTQIGTTAPIFINTAGNFTISGTGSNTGIISLGTFNATQAGSSQLTYVSGTVVGSKNISIYYGSVGNAFGVKLDTSSVVWDNIYVKDGANIAAASTNIVNLSSPLRFTNMFLTAASSVNYTTDRRPLRFIGTSILQGGTFSAHSIMMNNYTTNVQSSYVANIQFTPNAGTTHSFTNFNVVGMPNGKALVSSTTATKVGLSFSNILYNVDVTSLQAPSTTFLYGGTPTTSTNFVTTTLGSGISTTYVN